MSRPPLKSSTSSRENFVKCLLVRKKENVSNYWSLEEIVLKLSIQIELYIGCHS